MTKLPMRLDPQTVLLPQIQRSIAQITPELRTTIRKVVQGEAPWPLFLHGSAGGGKTCASLCLLDHSKGWYYTASSLCEHLINAQRGQIDTTVFLIWESVARCTLFVLDDLGGRDKVSDFHYETIKQVLDLRHGKPLVVTSNHALEALERLYDDRITSRLASGTIVALSGKDRRLNG